MGQIQQVLDALNDGADVDLGSVVANLDGRGMFDQADILENGQLWYDFGGEWGDGMEVVPVLEIDAGHMGMLSDTTFDAVDELLRTMNSNFFVQVRQLVVRPLRAPADWRERRQAARESAKDRAVHNQATYRAAASLIRADRLGFASEPERRVYEALKQRQAVLPEEATIGILPGCAMRVRGHTFWPDFLVTHRGRAGIIEVDGPHHSGRAAADHSRDGFLTDAGITLVERVVVEDTTGDLELAAFVERFLSRLLR